MVKFIILYKSESLREDEELTYYQQLLSCFYVCLHSSDSFWKSNMFIHVLIRVECAQNFICTSCASVPPLNINHYPPISSLTLQCRESVFIELKICGIWSSTTVDTFFSIVTKTVRSFITYSTSAQSVVYREKMHSDCWGIYW